jgi:hypothetical protein
MTRNSAHVTLEEFTAYLNDEPADTAFWAHLSACALCDTEMRKWRAVADGVRQAAPHASRPAPIQPLYGVLASAGTAAPAARPRGRRRPLLLATGSAAVVTAILGAVALAVSLAGGQQDPPITGDQDMVGALVATDCAELKVAMGTLESTSANGLVLRTADGKTVTVSAGGETKVVQQVPGDLADITDGVPVMVRGQGIPAGNQITAARVVILPGVTKPPNMPDLNGFGNAGQMMASLGHAWGTASEVGGGGFTLTGSRGTAIKVVTSASTSVVKPLDTTLDKLKPGKFTVVVGTLDGNGNLVAKNIEQNTLVDGAVPGLLPLPLGSGPPDRLRDNWQPGQMPRDLWPSGFPGRFGKMFSGLGCDANVIANSAIHGVTR